MRGAVLSPISISRILYPAERDDSYLSRPSITLGLERHSPTKRRSPALHQVGFTTLGCYHRRPCRGPKTSADFSPFSVGADGTDG